LIVRKIIKTVATICQILRLNASELISAGALPHTMLGDLQRSPDPLDRFRGHISNGRGVVQERKGEKEGKAGKG